MTEIRPEKRISGILQRTILNLSYIENNKSRNGPFEFTQLVNSFMGAAVHPWEQLLKDEELLVMNIRREVQWPRLVRARRTDDKPYDFHEQMAWIRHAFAHGNIRYINKGGNVVGIEIRNSGYSRKQKKNIAWGTRLDEQKLKALLSSYCKIAQRVDARKHGMAIDDSICLW